MCRVDFDPASSLCVRRAELMWTTGRVRTCFETVADKDTGVIYDFLSCAESTLTDFGLLKLDMCRHVIDVITKMLLSKFEK